MPDIYEIYRDIRANADISPFERLFFAAWLRIELRKWEL